MPVTITHIDTACVLIDINGFTILTDPTLDDAGRLYYHGYGSFSRKTDDPALHADALPPIDLILLSHHQHKDNFDNAGQAFTKTVNTVISTKAAAKSIPGMVGLSPWESFYVNTARVPGLTITATPAQHHPWWIPEFISGPVIGFVIEYDEQEQGVLYISGDTVYFKGIEEVGRRYTVDTGIFHVGAVQFRYLTGWGKYTMDSKDLIKAVKVISPNTIIPIHQRGWTHFKEKESSLKAHLQAVPSVYKRTLWLERGVRTMIG